MAAARAAPPASSRPFPQPGPSPLLPSSVTSLHGILSPTKRAQSQPSGCTHCWAFFLLIRNPCFASIYLWSLSDISQDRIRCYLPILSYLAIDTHESNK